MLRLNKTHAILTGTALTMMGVIFSSAIIMGFIALAVLARAMLSNSLEYSRNHCFTVAMLFVVTSWAFHCEFWLLGMAAGYPLAGLAAYIGANNMSFNRWQPS